MKRQEFIKTTSAMIAGSWLVPYAPGVSQTTQTMRKNWAGNYTYKAEKLYEPESADELADLVARLGKQKALGSRHCFNDIADSPNNQISTARLNRIVSMDRESLTVTIEGGVRYGDFAEQLHSAGMALHNLASLPHITVAGACTTATHGSGVSLGNLATPVVSVEMVTPDGSVKTIHRNDRDFPGLLVGLGALGIITRLTLQAEPTYDVRQDVYQDLPLESLQTHFDDIMSAGYSVSLFTDWMNGKVSQVWVKRRMDQQASDLGTTFYGATAATRNLHPITEISPENCTDQLGQPGPWFNRLPHFKMGFMPSGGEELQSEYFVPRENAVDAIMAIEKMKERINPQLFISEIRTIAADDFWMSPCYHRDSVAIHFTWKPNWAGVGPLLPEIEAALAPYHVRPHWGKLFTMAPETLHQRYERFSDFLALIKTYDPEGKFRNAYLDLNVY